MIEFRANPIKTIPNTDWIFFSSKNSVKFFFSQGFTCGNRKIACIGEGTFKALSRHVKTVHYCGTNVDADKISLEFSETLRDRTCLFPISNISKKTIQKNLAEKQVFDCVVYQTAPVKNINLPYFDVLIFTSPSNVENYYSTYPVKPKQHIIAMGPSTGNHLKKLGLYNYQTPILSGELGLIDALLKVTFR